MRERIQNRLLNSIHGNRPPHALLLAGLDSAGAYLLAKTVASEFCLGKGNRKNLYACPDYQEADGTTLNVEQARELAGSLTMSGVQGKNRCILIQNAHRMTVLVQNTLLKVIEEPPDCTLLILTGNETGILQTIRSRCMIVRIGGDEPKLVKEELMRSGKPAETAELCAKISDGIYGDALRYADPEYLEFREHALQILEEVIFQAAPFSEIRSIITVSGGSGGIEDTQETEVADNGTEEKRKKKKKPDLGKAQDLINIWQCILRDALCMNIMQADGTKRNLAVLNSDAMRLIQRISVSLPSKGIQSIIEILLKAQEKLAGGANPAMVLDAVVAELCKRETV